MLLRYYPNSTRLNVTLDDDAVVETETNINSKKIGPYCWAVKTPLSKSGEPKTAHI